jgi:hypothetical protein
VTGGDPGQPHPVDAAAVQRELADIDAWLAAGRAQATAAVRYGPLAGAFAGGTAALLLGLVAVVSVAGGVQDGDVAAGTVAAALLGIAAAGLAVLAGMLYRRAFGSVLALSAQRRALLARRQQLIAALAGPGARPGPGPGSAPGLAAGAGSGADPTASARQPTAWAMAMHAKFPLGPAPADVLRRLPADAPAWKAWLARNVGWGAAAAVLLLLAVALLSVLLTVLFTAG